MPVYQLIVGAHSQQPHKKIIYASHRLYLVNNYEGCCTPKVHQCREVRVGSLRYSIR